LTSQFSHGSSERILSGFSFVFGVNLFRYFLLPVKLFPGLRDTPPPLVSVGRIRYSPPAMPRHFIRIFNRRVTAPPSVPPPPRVFSIFSFNRQPRIKLSSDVRLPPTGPKPPFFSPGAPTDVQTRYFFTCACSSAGRLLNPFFAFTPVPLVYPPGDCLLPLLCS